jgi:hypothetical protein
MMKKKLAFLFSFIFLISLLIGILPAGSSAAATDEDPDASDMSVNSTLFPVPVGSISVMKCVTGANPPTAEFAVTVQFSAGPFGRLSGILVDGVTMPTTTPDVYELQLCDGETVNFTNIPQCTTYTVTETLTKEQQDAGWSNTIVIYDSHDTPSIDIAGDYDPVVVNNTYCPPPVGELTIVKALDDESDPHDANQLFQVKAEFKKDDAYVDPAGIPGDGSVSKLGTGIYQVDMKVGDTVNFTGIPVGTVYHVSEPELPSGWSTTSITSDDAEPPEEIDFDSDEDIVTVTNKFTQTIPTTTGQLIVTKTVTGTGADQTKEFVIDVLFDAPEGTLTGITVLPEAVPVDDGDPSTLKYSISLHHGESYTFSNIPLGTLYSVTETEVLTGYWSYGSGNAAEVELNAENLFDTVTITNNYYIPDPGPGPGPGPGPTPSPSPTSGLGSLCITKNVLSAGASTTEKFDISITFKGNVNGILPSTGSNETDGTYLISLASGESFTFTNIPDGTTYEVAEALTEEESAAGWAGSVTNAAGTISGSAVNVAVNNTLNPGEPPAPPSDSAILESEGSDVAGAYEVLPKTGGFSPATLFLLTGMALICTGTIMLNYKKKSRSK